MKVALCTSKLVKGYVSQKKNFPLNKLLYFQNYMDCLAVIFELTPPNCKRNTIEIMFLKIYEVEYYRSCDDLNYWLDHSILGCKVQSSKHVRKNWFFFHLSKLLSNTISWSSRKWNVRIGMSLPENEYQLIGENPIFWCCILRIFKKSFGNELFWFFPIQRISV